MENENNKNIVSLQLPSYVYKYLKRRAYIEGATVSFIIRSLILKDIKENGEDINGKE